MVRHAGAAAVALGGFTVMMLAGCAPIPVACPAIGWTNSLTVEFAGDTSLVDRVQLCVDDECAPGSDVSTDSPLSLIAVTDESDDGWTFATDMQTLSVVTVRALASDGTISFEESVEPDWKRVGGSEECGGPHEAVVAVAGP